MSDVSRRGFIGSAAFAAGLAGAGVGGTSRGDDPGAATGAEPAPAPFTYALERQEPVAVGGNSARAATVAHLPGARGLAGSSLRLEPGGRRDLHWHPDAGEWAFVVAGHVRATVVDPSGDREVVDCGPGDVWYVPRGHGHGLHGLGPGTAHCVLIFDDGQAAELGAPAPADWLGGAARALAARGLGLPESALAGAGGGGPGLATGPVPPREPAPPLHGALRPGPHAHRYALLAAPPDFDGDGGREWRLDRARFPIAPARAGVVLDLEPGALRELHWHPDADEWQYVVAGRVAETVVGAGGRSRTATLDPGDVGHVPRGHAHAIENVGDAPARLLLGFNAGRYEAVDLSAWLAGNPADALGAGLGLPAEVVARVPRDRVVIAPARRPGGGGVA